MSLDVIGSREESSELPGSPKLRSQSEVLISFTLPGGKPDGLPGGGGGGGDADLLQLHSGREEPLPNCLQNELRDQICSGTFVDVHYHGQSDDEPPVESRVEMSRVAVLSLSVRCYHGSGGTRCALLLGRRLW